MNKPVIVLLDTSALDCSNYAFYTGTLESLQKYIQRGEVEMWLSNITVKEAEHHLKKYVSDIIKRIKIEKGLSILKKVEKYQKFFEVTDCEQAESDAAADAVKEFNSFLTRNRVKVLDNSGITIDAIFDDYFAEKPPFSDKKDKKAEFPDAIMIAKIKKELSNLEELHIISADDDWQKAFENERKVVLYKATKDFLNCLNKRGEIFNSVKSFLELEDIKMEIQAKTNDLLDNMIFEVDGQEYDRKGITGGYEYDEVLEQRVVEVKIKFDSIEFIDSSLTNKDAIPSEGNIKAVVYCVAKIAVECSYFDEDNSIWDSVDKEYFHRATGSANEEHRIEFPIYINILAKKENDLQLKVIEIDFDEVPNELDSETLLSRDYKVNTFCDEWDERDSRFRVDKTYKCPKCGTDINIELVGYAEIVCSKERQMGAETEYQVECDGDCPTCGKKYKITGGIWEYPVLVLNYDETKISWKE